MIKDRKVEIDWADFIDIWHMAYKAGYSRGYVTGGCGTDYDDEEDDSSNPPGVLKRIFESYGKEEEE